MIEQIVPSIPARSPTGTTPALNAGRTQRRHFSAEMRLNIYSQTQTHSKWSNTVKQPARLFLLLSATKQSNKKSTLILTETMKRQLTKTDPCKFYFVKELSVLSLLQ